MAGTHLRVLLTNEGHGYRLTTHYWLFQKYTVDKK